jgi:UDP-N-acetylmuramoyl-L-alanine---L-glutamate ligase
MPPRLRWADLAGAKVGVWGLGVEGRANVARLAREGVAPILVDDRGELARGGGDLPAPVHATHEGGIDELAACEVVVKSPGISRHGSLCTGLEAGGVAVVGGLGLWLEEVDRSRVLATTGTKGKSTTTAIAGHLLDRWGYRVVLGGNIGQPPWDPTVPDDADWWVIEVSSYQATDVTTGPEVVAVTSLHADHLTWHGDVVTYERDKLGLCTRPGVRITVASGVDERLRDRAALLGPAVRWVGPADEAWAGRLGLIGAHNLVNAEVARVALVELGVTEAAADDALVAGANGFAGLESRLQTVWSADGVTFVDDSLSTNVLPTLAAVDAFSGRRVALLVGGHDRGIDYAPLAVGLAGRGEPTLVVTLPDNGERVAAALAAEPSMTAQVEVADDLDDAVVRAFGWARPDGVVLLSPAAPSFGRFRDYRHRAEVFTEAARRVST